MEILAFLIAVAAIIVLGFEYARTRALATGGLALFVVAFVLQLVIVGGLHVTA